MGAWDRIARSLQGAGRSIGVAITGYPPPGSLARHLRVLFQRFDTNCVIDVGAHRGGYARMLRDEVGFGGHIVSFEPAPESFDVLSRIFEGDRRWRGHRFALGRAPGTADLRIFPTTELNSLLDPTPYGEDRFGTPETLTVDVRALANVLDDVTEHLAGPRIHLKIDAQGFDMEVIEGAVAVLDRISTLQTELSLKPIYRGQPLMGSALARLAELGFQPTGMFPAAFETDRLRLIEVDCVLVRSDEAMHLPSSRKGEGTSAQSL